MSERELYPTALVGWRTWIIRSGRLCSFGMGHAWRPGLNRAECKTAGSHPAPDHECACGLYAYHEPAQALEASRMLNTAGLGRAVAVSGVVAARGNVELHDEGFRAEEAIILGLLFEEGFIWPSEHHSVAERYLVPVLREVSGLEELANGFIRQTAPGESHV